MIFLFKNKIFKTALTVFLSVGCFLGAAFACFNINISQDASKVDKAKQNVPYKSIPVSCGVMFVLPSNSAMLCYLDFEKEHICVLDVDRYDSAIPEYYGYSVDYTVQVNYELIEGVVDRVGGVDINKNGTIMRYTGVQIIELIENEYSSNIKKQIISQIFLKISNNGFSADDFIFIIENTKSNLVFTECIFWLDYIEKMSKNVTFIS